MQPSIRLTLSLTGTAALALGSIPFDAARADDTKLGLAAGNAKDLGVMGVNLKDAVKLNYGFQGALQGAGTPNQAGLGAFIPVKVSKNSVSFVDVIVNANFSDYGNYSSIINTSVEGITFSTSTRLGYRWLNSNRSWMYGVNAGYDSRPMATGKADSGVNVTNSQTVFFQQVAAGLEAVSNTWNFNAYALVPVGTTDPQQLNSYYVGSPLNTFGLDVGYAIKDFTASLGYYYQNDELISGSGLLTRLSYGLTNGLTLGVNYSYDQAFQSRVSGDIKYRFGRNGYGSPRKQEPVVMPVIQALSATPTKRDVRVHDAACLSTPSGAEIKSIASSINAFIAGVGTNGSTGGQSATGSNLNNVIATATSLIDSYGCDPAATVAALQQCLSINKPNASNGINGECVQYLPSGGAGASAVAALLEDK
jgi:hypothetical protein